MTTLELYRKHKKGEIGRDRFLYEVRRDNNLPWITNITSYDDAVKILKNKGIIKEAQFEPQNIPTDPLVDRVNPYALKREVEKLLSKETELTNDSYKEALNKAAKKLTTPEAVKKAMFANAETVEKADAKLQMQPVKKANHLDKNNSMKKVKGQEMPKATAAPTGENKKTKKPKGVEIMKDKGVEGSEKVLREAALAELQSYLKKNLRINEEERHDYHLGQEVHLPGGGMGKIVEMIGGTCVVEMEDGSHKHLQLNVLNRAKNEAMKASEQATEVKEEVVDDNNRGFQNGDKIKITSELSRYRGAIGEIHDLHDDGTAMVILDDPKRTAITVDLSHVRKLRPDELGEAADVVSYTDASSGQKKVAGIYPAGKGSKEVMGLKTMGVTSAKVDQAK